MDMSGNWNTCPYSNYRILAIWAQCVGGGTKNVLKNELRLGLSVFYIEENFWIFYLEF